MMKSMDSSERLQSTAWIDEQGEEGLVSVVVPVHNRAGLVAETLNSIRAQTYRPIELIIVDDGSKDDSLELIENWARTAGSNDVFTVSVLAQQQSGAQAARNRGLKTSRGEFIQLFDSDDIMVPEKLHRQVAILCECPTTGFVTCDCSYFTDDIHNPVEAVRFSQLEHTATGHVRGVVLNFPTTLYRRSTIVRLGPLDEDLSACQDFEYNFRLFAKQINGVWLPEYLTLLRHHDDSITAQRLDTHRGSLHAACMKVEAACHRHGIDSPEMLDAIGKRILFYLALPLKKKWRIGLSLRYYLKAWSMMCWRSRLTGTLHWLLGR